MTCAVVDALKPMVVLLVNLQNLQAPSWKICVRKDKVKLSRENEEHCHDDGQFH